NRPPHFPARTFLTARNPSTNRTMRSLVQDLGVKLREMAFAVNRVVGGEHLPRRPPRPVALDDADNGDVADLKFFHAFPRSFGGLQIRLAANWLPDCIHNGKLTCQRTIQPGSRLKLVLGAAGCAFVTPLATKEKREYGHRCDQQDGDGLSSALLPPP